MGTLAEARASQALIQAKLDSVPWAMPAISPAIPNATGSINVSRVTIPADASTYSDGGRRFQGTPVGYRLEGTGININGLTLSDTELQQSNIGFRSYGAGTVRGLKIERMHLPTGIYTPGIPIGLIYSQGTNLIDAVFRDLLYNGTQGVTDGSAIVGGIVLSGKGSTDIGNGILIEDFDLRNLLITAPSAYPNSDGVSIERGYLGVRLRRGRVINGADTGYDIKAPDAWLDDVYAEGWRQSGKFWNPLHLGAFYSANPKFAHILLTRETQGAWAEPMVIEHLNCRNTVGLQPIFRMEDGTRRVIVKSYDLSGCRPGTPLISRDSLSAASVVDWGPQGTPVL
jgi:hypothetical protein